MHFIIVLLTLFGLDAQTIEQAHVLLGLRIRGGQQAVAVEDRVGAGEEGQGLGLLVHLFAASGQAYVGFRHHDPRDRQGANEVEGIDVLFVLQRCALDLDQHVDRHALGVLGQVCQLDQQASAVLYRLAHTENTAGADLHARVADVGQGLEPVTEGTGRNDIAVELRRGIKVVVVVVQARIGQRRGLLLGQLAKGHAGFQTELAHALDHLQDVGHVLLGGVLPGRAHAETGGTDRLGCGGFVQHLLHFQQLFLFQTGVVVTRLRTILAVLRA